MAVLSVGQTSDVDRSALKIQGWLRQPIFWLVLAFYALLPATLTPWLDVAGLPLGPWFLATEDWRPFEGLPINLKDLTIVLLALVYTLPAYLLISLKNRRPNYYRRLPLYTIGIALYALLSTIWSGMDEQNAWGMRFATCLSLTALLAAWGLVVRLSLSDLLSFLDRLAMALAVISAVYFAESFFGLGLRSAAGQAFIDFGIQRVHGPLYGSAVGHFILLPALGYTLQRLLDVPQNRSRYLGGSLMLLLCILGLGSRAALLLLGLFLLTVPLVIRKAKQRYLLIGLGLVLTASAGAIVFSRASPERLKSAEEYGRLFTHQTSWATFRSETLSTRVLGAGEGAYWPWYIRDVEQPYQKLGLLTDTPYGLLLYQPHSTFLFLGLELGFLGLLYFGKFWLCLARMLYVHVRFGPCPVFACSLFISGLAMFLDFFLFRPRMLEVVYWLFLLGAMQVSCLTHPKEADKRLSATSPSSPSRRCRHQEDTSVGVAR